MKKVSLNFVFVILIISFVGSILFGALVRHHYIGGTKFANLQKVAVFFENNFCNLCVTFFIDEISL